MVEVTNLKRGDIIIIKFNGVPYHAVIYAPNPEQIGDVIHMGYGLKRSGLIRSTLAHTIYFHHELKNTGNLFHPWQKNKIETQVIRSKTLSGEEIANQAECWLKQGILYDEKRLMDALINKDKDPDTSIEAQANNVFQYLKFAARRETAPIKNPIFPHPISSFAAGIGVILTIPSYNLYKPFIKLGFHLMDKGTAYEGRPKGFSCAGFVLACIGAAALKDEIKAITPEGGWVSFKHGSMPEDKKSNYAINLQKISNNLNANNTKHPGLHTLLSEEQIKNFNIDHYTHKLTPFLANLNPQRPSIKSFMAGIEKDKENWEDLGPLSEIKLGKTILSTSKVFNKEEYKVENKKLLQDIKENREQFKKDFGNSAFQHEKYSPPSFFKRFIAKAFGEEISDIANKQTLKLSN
ncbi:hypothetical protein ACNVED_02835 [Legionella sp. D16C41]|uniref:hypothetical protein n=1 Tax=Legionella sp. D16C41 TaxID=3402688 RepID=UPI003AF5760B